MNLRTTPTHLHPMRHFRRALCLASVVAIGTARAAIVTSTWTNAVSGNWNVDANWTNVPALGGFPDNGNGGVATYDAVISATGTAYTVTLNTSIAVDTLTLASVNATLSHTAGTLATNLGLGISAGTYLLSNSGRIHNSAITLSGTGALTLAGGTIQGGTITGSSAAGLTVAESNSGTFSAVNLGTNLTIGNSATLDVTNGLTLGNNAKVILAHDNGPATALRFGGGAQTLGGNGEVVFGGNGFNNQLQAQGLGTVASTLTIGPGITVRGTQNGSIEASNAIDSILNQGTILAETPSRFIFLSGKWSNTGLLRATSGGTLNLRGNFTTAGLGTFNSNGGTIAITGVMDNTGTTLATSAATGPLVLSQNGIIRNGTVAASLGGGLSVPDFSAGTLDGVTLQNDVTVGNSATLDATNGLTLGNNAKVILAHLNSTGTVLRFGAGAQTLGGNGEVVFSSGFNNQLQAQGLGTVASTLTIGPGITVRGTQSGSIQAVNAIDSILNQGTILADAPATGISLQANWSNTGLLRAMNGGTLNLVLPGTEWVFERVGEKMRG